MNLPTRSILHLATDAASHIFGRTLESYQPQALREYEAVLGEMNTPLNVRFNESLIGVPLIRKKIHDVHSPIDTIEKLLQEHVFVDKVSEIPFSGRLSERAGLKQFYLSGLDESQPHYNLNVVIQETL